MNRRRRGAVRLDPLTGRPRSSVRQRRGLKVECVRGVSVRRVLSVRPRNLCPMRLDGKTLALLRCPRCHGRLEADRAHLACTDCRESYLVSRGVPILLRPDNELFDAHRIAEARNSWIETRGLRRLVPTITKNLASEQNFAHLRDLLLEQSSEPRVLLIGAGEGGIGLGALRHPGITLVQSDVEIAVATGVVADAHDLPFDDSSFDAVVAQAVMEHVLDPVRCVSEIHRVLNPTGLVYAETPFMQQVHFGAYDFTRWTPLGHRRLFRYFEEIQSGIAVGPGSALAWSITHFLRSFTRRSWTRKLVGAASHFMLWWLKGFDKMLTTEAAHDAPSGVYFIGRKATAPISDAALIAGYPGAMRKGEASRAGTGKIRRQGAPG